MDGVNSINSDALVASVRQEVESLRQLAAVVKGYQTRVEQVHSQVTGSTNGLCTSQLEEELMRLPACTHGTRTTSPAAAHLHDWVVPADLAQDPGIQESGAAALQMLRAVDESLQRARGVLEAAVAADSKRRHMLDALQRRADNSRSPLLQLPQEVLRTIARQAGGVSRLVCGHLYHTYGSPATHLTIDETDLPELPLLLRWPAPAEVESCELLFNLPSNAVQSLLQTFTQLRTLVIAASSSLPCEQLPASLTSLVLMGQEQLPAGTPLQLGGLSHLTSLQALTLNNVEQSPGALQPLRALSALTLLQLDQDSQGLLALQPAMSVPPDAWGVFCALPRLQQLSLQIPLDLAAPLPADATGLGALTQLSIDCDVAMAALGHPHLHQVFQLLPRDCTLELVCFQSPCIGDDTSFDVPLLQQAFASLSCRHLHLTGKVPPAHLADIIRPALPSVESLSMYYTAYPALNATAAALFSYPLPALQSLSLTWRDKEGPPDTAFHPSELLDTLSTKLPSLTQLHLSVPDAATHIPDWQSCTSLARLTALRSLTLGSFTLCALAAPSLPQLPALSHLSLSVLRNHDNPRRTCLPSSCSVVSSLTALTSLSLGTPRIARQVTELPQVARTAECALPLVKYLGKLKQLQLGNDHSPSLCEASMLLPLPKALTAVDIMCPHEYRENCCYGVLTGEDAQDGYAHWASLMRRALAGQAVELRLLGRLARC